MNFYIGNSINEINIKGKNVEFSDELMNYIYQLKEETTYSLQQLFGIDPYADIEIPKDDIPEIISICNYILAEALLENYAERDEGIEMVSNLERIAQKALSEQMGLISIGD